MNRVVGYKVFNSDFKCRDFQYEVGKEYHNKGKLLICENGFHCCEKLINCFNYYTFNPKNKVAIVELFGEIITKDNKFCGSSILIKEEITWQQVLELVNTGEGNTGNGNSGDTNSGNWNSGDTNSGDTNSGNGNTGHRNSGNGNSGHMNSGNGNSGDTNSGNWNSGNGNSGCLNYSDDTMVRVFEKRITRDEYNNIRFPNFFYFYIINKIPYKEAFVASYNNATDEDRELVKAIPGFDREIFFNISGIMVD